MADDRWQLAVSPKDRKTERPKDGRHVRAAALSLSKGACRRELAALSLSKGGLSKGGVSKGGVSKGGVRRDVWTVWFDKLTTPITTDKFATLPVCRPELVEGRRAGSPETVVRSR
jgi:hypothetical protein